MTRQAFLKTLSYAAMHMSLAILVAYVLSGSWKVALAIGLVEPCVQTVAYFFHEQAWHKVEQKSKTQDHHDGVIDSTTPIANTIEKIISHRH